MLIAVRPDGHQLDTDPARLDVGLLHTWLSTDAYWSMGRSRDVLERVLAGSLNYGLYAPQGAMVGFTRVVTDGALFAYLCDVYVDRTARGAGLGTWLVGTVIEQVRGLGCRRLLLATADAHDLYAKFGFVPLSGTDRWMELTSG